MAWLFIIAGILFIAVAGYVLLTMFAKKPQSQDEKISDIHENKLSTDMNRFAARKEAKASEARTNLSNQINLEADTYRARERRESEIAVLQAQEETEIVRNEAAQAAFESQKILIQKAIDKGWDVNTYLEIEKTAEMNRLELEKEWRQAEQSLKGGFIFQMQAHQQLSLMTEYIGGLYDKAEQLKEQGKTREYELIENHIAFMEADFNGRQRLLQAANGQDFEGSDENS